MNKKNLVKILNKEVTILSDFVEGFMDSDSIHPKEVDLTLSKVKDIYELLSLLKEDEDQPKLTVEEEPQEIVVTSLKTKMADEKVEEKVEKEVNPIVEPAKEPGQNLAQDVPVNDNSKLEVDEIVEEQAIEEPLQEEIHKVDNEEVLTEPEKAVEADFLIQKTEVVVEEKETIEAEEDIIANAEEESIDDKPDAEPEPKDEPLNEVNPEDEVSQEIAELKEGELEEVKEKVEESGVQEDIHVTNIKKETVAAKQDAVKAEKQAPEKGEIIADQFSKDTPSVNDMLAGFKKNKDLASRLKESPITDLKKAVKLNDRIWYINELFNKNGTTYEKTIDQVNKAANLDEALEYLFSNFTWDQDRKSTVSFLELVFRRFASK